MEWSNINPATDFVIFKPSTRYGKKIPSEYSSNVYFGYDDKAVYLAADFKHPDSKKIRNPKPTAIKIPNQIKPLIKKNAKLPSNKYLPYLFFCSSNLKFFKSFILL